MKIYVKSDDTRLNLIFPTKLLFSSFTLKLLTKYGSKGHDESGCKLTSEQIRQLAAELNRFKRKHRRWVLIDVKSAEGEHVKIVL